MNSRSHFFLYTFFFLMLFSSCRLSQPFVAEEPWHESREIEDQPVFTAEFTPEEFVMRRDSVMEQIGDTSIAVIQGVSLPGDFRTARQNNELYYLSGIESPHSYLILDGYNRESILFVPEHDKQQEYGEGRILSIQDSTFIKEISGVDVVRPLYTIISELRSFNANNIYQTLFTHQSPYEEQGQTRETAYRELSDQLEDPLDNRPARFEHLNTELQKTAPVLDIENLDQIVDEMRKIKSDAELALIEISTRLHGEVLLEAMRSTEVGVTAYELDAVGSYLYRLNNAGVDTYPIIHIGPDIYLNHYHENVRSAKGGDMILMDYGAFYKHYTSDMARMWPANGEFNPVQRELYSFYLIFYESLLYNIETGLTPQQVIQNALEETDEALTNFTFSADHRREAAERFLNSYRRAAENSRLTLGHGVGLSPEDVGDYTGPLEPGMVFVIEPEFQVPEENVYIRLEDVVTVTEDGVKILSDFVPRDIRGIEGIMQERGLLQKHPFVLDE